jgi:hypothetical protein
MNDRQELLEKIRKSKHHLNSDLSGIFLSSELFAKRDDIDEESREVFRLIAEKRQSVLENLRTLYDGLESDF